MKAQAVTTIVCGLSLHSLTLVEMIKKFIDRVRLTRDLLRRRLAMWRWDGPNQATGPFIDRVVFIRWDAKLGDAIVQSWALREIKKQRPDLKITVVTSPLLESLFRKGYGIDSVYLAGKKYGWSQLPQIAQILRYSRYVVHMSEIWRPRELRFVRKLSAQEVVGLDDGLQMISVKLGEATKGKHFSESLVPWLEHLGINTENRQYWVPRSEQAAAKVAKSWPKAKIIGLCPYGASKNRQLSTAQIRFLISNILLDPQVNVWVCVLSDQLQDLRKDLIQESWFSRVFFDVTDDTLELCEQVAHCDALVSVDTAIVHIASGLNKPLLALYALHHNQFEMWGATSTKSVCQFVVMGPPSFTSQESIALESGIQTLLRQI